MDNITFTATATFPKPSVVAFAMALGWTAKIEDPNQVESGSAIIEKIDNPVTPEQFVAIKFKENSVTFASQASILLVERDIEEARLTAIADVKIAIEQAIAVTIE